VDPTGSLVAQLPAPIAYDSSAERSVQAGSFSLTDTSLIASIDPEWLNVATYPVVIDPSWNATTSRDGYTNQSTSGTSYESADWLQVDSGKRIYLNFNTNAIEGAGVLVYDAQLFLYPDAAGGVTGGITAERVLDPWPAAGTLKWSNQPALGVDIDTQSTANGGNGWWAWDLTELYQHYIDQANTPNPHWTNYGVALTSTNPKTFYSADNSLANTDPALYVTYNNLPNSPNLDGPTGGYVSESEALTLSVDQIPNDPDGDDVMVSFQISDDGTNWSGSHLVFQSPYDDAKSFTVPAGVLLDGQTYHWRAVSLDVCAPQSGGMCSLTDGAGTNRDPNASNSRSFTVQLEHLGHDDRWAMWSHDVGSDMTLEVNQGNGNLFLDVPLASYATPIGPMNVALGYNSLEPVGEPPWGSWRLWSLSIAGSLVWIEPRRASRRL
jgi:hypothetical protein